MKSRTKKRQKKKAVKPKKLNSHALKELQFPGHLVENRIIQELRSTVQKLRIFDSLGKTLTSTLDLHEILRTVVEKLGGQIESRYSALILLNQQTNEFYYEYPKVSAEFECFPVGKGLLGKMLEQGRGELEVQPFKNPVWISEIDGLVVEKPSSMMTIPIVSKGAILGLLVFLTEKDQPAFADRQYRFLETFSDYLAIAIENARNFKSVQELTVSDDLTGLFNSRYLHLVLEREIARSERYKESLGLVFLDIDNFKMINDQHGHMVGSQLLKEFGAFLLSVTRTSDVAIRYGGDEFVLVLPRTDKTESLRFVNRVMDRLHATSFLKNRNMNVKMTASFGVAAFPDDGHTIDALISSADKAMYVVKKGTKDGVYAASRPVTLIGSKM